MGGKGGKKRKGGGVPTPGFGAGGRGGPSGGLPSPSPTPSVGGWETEDERFGLGGAGFLRLGRPGRRCREWGLPVVWLTWEAWLPR